MPDNKHSPADYTHEFDSPFLSEELFSPESEEEWEPRASALASESPFQSAFERGPERFDTPEMEEPRSFDEAPFLEGETGVINGDNRVRVTPTVGVPWRWICRVEVKGSRDSQSGGGTGVLISDRHVLTAAHVVYEAARNMQNFSIQVIPALDYGDQPFGSYSVSAKPKLPRNYSPDAANHLDWDYALLKLDTAAGKETFPKLKGNALCFWGSQQCGANSVFARPDPATLNGKAVFTAGYPRSEGAKKLMCAAGILHSVNRLRRTMSITADTTKGQSGSPVWIVENQRYCLVGIAAGAGQHSNRVVRVTRELVRQLRAWITEDGETPSIVETEEELESPAVALSSPEAEHYERLFSGWSPEPSAEEAEDFAGAEYEEDQLELLREQPVEEPDDQPAVPKSVADALAKKDWPLALRLYIQAGQRDENELTNIVFFARHPELPREKLDPKHPKIKQLSDEWAKILNKEVWDAIKASAENTDLVVSGKEVADHQRFFRGKSGKRLKQLVGDAAREVDINPGLLGTIMMAETRSPRSYLLSGKVSSYLIGVDDFYEARNAIRARVPAYAKIKWDKKQQPEVHDNDAQKNPRKVKTIMFDSGPDAVLATAVYVKFYEILLREAAAKLKGDFDALPTATRLALTRMAMAAGIGGVTPRLKEALAGKDIFVRRAIPVKIYQTQRNATVRTAQAMHLSDWVFGIPVPAAAAQPELETFEGFDDAEFDEAEFGEDEFVDDEFEDDAEAYAGDIDPELAGEVEHPDHETEDDAPSFEMLVPQVPLADLRARIDEYFNLAKASYLLPGGTAVSARPQFRQAEKVGSETAIKRVSLILGKAFEKSHPKAIRMAAYGRAKPAEIAAITQALIDERKLPAVSAVNPGFDNEQLVRALQREFKMGIDCAGYVQLAFIFAFTGSDDDPPSVRRSLGLHERRGWERLEALPGGHFTKVAVVDAQTGDLFVMKPRAGSNDRSWHTVIIVDHTSSGKIHTFLCDASWGTDLYGVTAGGVARRTLKHNTETGEWWDVHPLNGSDAHKNTTGPYNGHPIHGMFRAKPKK